MANDISGYGKRMFVRRRVVIGDTALARVDVRAPLRDLSADESRELAALIASLSSF